MITTLILTKVMDYMFFIGLLWAVLLISGIIRYFRDGDHVTINMAFWVFEMLMVFYLRAVLPWKESETKWFWVIVAGLVIWGFVDLSKAMRKTDEERKKRGIAEK